MLLLTIGVGACRFVDLDRNDVCAASGRPVFFYYHSTSKNEDFEVRLKDGKKDVKHPV